MTTKLIQELVGLTLKTKRVRVIFKNCEIEVRIYDSGFGATYQQRIISTSEDDAPAKLQAAIDKIKEL